MEPEFTQQHLDKVALSTEELDHYSKPDEIKRLLLERNFYKLAFEKQIEKINKASKHLILFLDSPISITNKTYIELFGFQKTRLAKQRTRDYIYEYRLQQLANQLV